MARPSPDWIISYADPTGEDAVRNVTRAATVAHGRPDSGAA